MAARTICIEIPEPPSSPLSITIPGAGDMETVREFALDAYNVCVDARAFIQQLQPVLGGLGLPLCILGCVTSLTEVFTSDFPFVDPSALTNMLEKCACLGTFTPFGFCSMLRGLIQGILALLTCVLGLMNDILQLEAQTASLLADPTTAAMGACLGRNAEVLRETVVSSFGPVETLFSSTEFLFSFVGVPFSGMGSLSGGTTADVIAAIGVITSTLNGILSTIGGICP